MNFDRNKNQPASPDDLNVVSLTYRCPEHGSWLHLRQLSASAGGLVRFWARPVMGCHTYKPAKHAQGSQRAKATEARRAREARDLPAWSSNIISIATRCCTTC